MAIKENLVSLSNRLTEGYKDSRDDEKFDEDKCERKLRKICEDSYLEGVLYACAVATGGVVQGLHKLIEEKATKFFMGYLVAESKTLDDGRVPFGRPIKQIEKLFSGISYDLGVFAFKAKKIISQF